MHTKSSRRRGRHHATRGTRASRRLELRRIVEYMVSGGMYFWAGYAVFFICDALIGLDLWWAKLIANLAGWTLNFVLQRYWVFRNPSLAQHRTEVTARYAIITLVNFVLDYAIVLGLAEVGLTPYLGQFISAGFFTVWNYLWYRLWVFTNHVHHRHPHHGVKRRAT